METVVSVALAFLLFITACYFFIVWRIYVNKTAQTERLSVLVARLAAFLPLYALCMFIAVIDPQLLEGIEVPIAVIEGYSFYLFFALIVENLGGPKGVVKAFVDANKPLCCCACICPSDAIKYYKQVSWAMFNLVTTRVVVIFFAAVAGYSGNKRGGAASSLLMLLAAVILFSCLPQLVMLYENIYASCTNIFGLMKFSMLKISVTLIVLQGLIESFMISAGSEPYNDDDKLSSEEKTTRGYCMLVLIEFVVLCFPYMYAYTYTITEASDLLTTPVLPADAEKAKNNTSQEISSKSNTGTKYQYPESTNFCTFLCRMLGIFDVFYELTYKE